MINIKEIDFGRADANREASLNPSKFKEAFYDPEDYLDELMAGEKFLLVGRKGDGKTAYGAQIELVAQEHNMYACRRTLDNFNDVTFEKLKTYEKLSTNPYISIWKCILLIEYVKMIYEHEPNIQKQEYLGLIDALRRQGFFDPDDDITITVDKLVESNTKITLKNVFQHNRKYNYDEELCGAEKIYSTTKKTIQSLYLGEKFILVIDGLDDLLKYKEFKPDVVTGLIRAVNDINLAFRKSTLSVKTVLLIRNDIYVLCRDANLSKIYRDAAIKLSWLVPENQYDSALLKLVGKRIEKVAGEAVSFRKFWEELFPDRIRNRSSLDYILENIIYRPRDILQLFIEIQKVAVPGKKLTDDKIRDALANYSEEYFVGAMQDEMTGFFPDNVVTLLPGILKRMESHVFKLREFEKECAQYPEFDNIPAVSILEQLFNAGYIGQRRPRENMDYTVFSYRNPRETFHPEDDCVVHRGLTRALTI